MFIKLFKRYLALKLLDWLSFTQRVTDLVDIILSKSKFTNIFNKLSYS